MNFRRSPAVFLRVLAAAFALVLYAAPACAQSTGENRDSARARADSAAKSVTVRTDSAKAALPVRIDSGAVPRRLADSLTRDTLARTDSVPLRRGRAAPEDSAVAGDSTTGTAPADTGARSITEAAAPASREPRDTAAADSAVARRRPRAKGDPVWPVAGPPPMRNSLLPGRRIVAYYGNPLSRRMGILGELPPDSMLKRLDAEVKAWNEADSTTPVKPALHLIAVVAQAGPGRDGKYRLRMTDSMIEMVGRWAESRNALVFLDVQIGLSTVEEEVTRLEKFLKRPNFHLGLDPEFAMTRGGLPGKRIGTLDAKHINWTIDYLASLVDKYGLAPKVLVVHRFTRPMLTNAHKIELDPRVQVVIQMDGWGPPRLKRDSYESYVWKEPVQFTGFKLFYKNDTKAGHPLMKPKDVLMLEPRPVYIQYQ